MYPEVVARGETCPLLEWNGKRYICKLVMTAGKQGDYYRSMLLVGTGCRQYLNPWRQDVRQRNNRGE